MNMESQFTKILIIAPAWIGDMVMAHTLIQLLVRQHPHAIIDVLAPSWTLPLAERMPEVTDKILFPFGHGELKLHKRYRFAKSLRNRKYDQAIVLPGSFKSALTAFWAKIPKRTGWLRECRVGLINDFRLLNRERLPLMVQQYAALGFPATSELNLELESCYPKLRIDQIKRQETIKKFGINLEKPVLAICPGAEYGPSKRWPVSSFAKVAGQMLSNGWQVWIFGSNKDKMLAEDLMRATDQECLDLTGKTSLLEAIDLMSLAKKVLSNDSGLMHIAAALQRPLVVLYGSSSPTFTPPLAKEVKILHLGLDCSPCFKRTCPLEHFNCMKQMTPEFVMTHLNGFSHD